MSPDISPSRLGRSAAEVLLACVIIARSGSFLLSKIALRSMQPLDLLSVRFIAAFAFLCLLFAGRLAKAQSGAVLRGLLLGFVFCATMACELMGLRTSDSSRIACLTLKNGLTGFAAGDLFGVASAMLYAAAIVITDRSARGYDALTIGIVQVGGMALFSTLGALACGGPKLPPTMTEWLCVAGLALVCTGFGFTLQPVAQSGTTAERAGLFCALAPVSAGILALVFLGETFTARSLIGAALVMTGILIPHFWR